jgi:hypothetical protein
MDYRSKSNGLNTFLENWWWLIFTAIVVLAPMVLDFVSRLNGRPWVWCYGIGLAVAAVGIFLIFYAKLPLYRQRRFLTFGTRALPESRRGFYCWGYRCVFLAVALLLCLFLSRPH